MNFNKYHVSRNLFSCNLEQGTISMQGEYCDANDRVRSDDFIIMETGEYTINALSESGTLRVFVFEFMEEGTFVTRMPPDWANVPYTFSLAGKRKMKFVFSYSSGNIMLTAVDSVMLNTGSSPLPYEPYSSEVWHDIPHYIMGTDADTITTLPAVIYANDTTATVGLKGDMQQSGTPTPQNPIQPSECGERTENLLDGEIIACHINTSGTLVSSSGYTTYYAEVEEGETYTFFSDGGGTVCYALYADLPTIGLTSIDNKRYDNRNTATIPSGCKYIVFRIDSTGSGVMIIKGSTTPSSYIPTGYKIPILSNSTTTNVYLGEVQSTRRIKKLVLDGTEDWTLSASRIFYTPVTPTAYNNITLIMCSHFEKYTDNLNLGVAITNDGTQLRLYDVNSVYSDVTAFKNFLAAQYTNGTPVTIWYVLATEETAVVNEPLRKIGDYADEVSGITIPTIAGANAVDVLTTLKPSEVTATYKGWHPVADVHERESGQWD